MKSTFALIVILSSIFCVNSVVVKKWGTLEMKGDLTADKLLFIPTTPRASLNETFTFPEVIQQQFKYKINKFSNHFTFFKGNE